MACRLLAPAWAVLGNGLMAFKSYDAISGKTKWLFDLDEKKIARALRRASNKKRSSPSEKGAWAELIASAWLLEKNYEVFRNVCGTGWVDLVAWKEGKVTLIDVKLVCVGEDGLLKGNSQPLTDNQISAEILPLFVTSDGVCDWSLTRLREIYRAARKGGKAA